ncbi:MAG: DUF1844 domain-containing protein [Planctomycetes bacterium]|nr:DUF1844 domain-containing protein [Planctomycetota bacterium]
MADDERKIIVDDDWKAEAQAEKERLAQEVAQPEELPEAGFAELVNLIAMQAMVGLGMVASPTGERLPANFELAKHFIDMLQALEDKTKGNLDDDEKKMMDQILYELRMRYIQATTGGAAPMGGATSPTA